jgi:hypothetical protein
VVNDESLPALDGGSGGGSLTTSRKWYVVWGLRPVIVVETRKTPPPPFVALGLVEWPYEVVLPYSKCHVAPALPALTTPLSVADLAVTEVAWPVVAIVVGVKGVVKVESPPKVDPVGR